jgi:C1A family cysteine protease
VVEMGLKKIEENFGWLPDPPDFLDYTLDGMIDLYGDIPEKKETVDFIAKLSSLIDEIELSPELSPIVDLRGHFSPIENQGSLGSCTAHAGVGLLEYIELKTRNKFIDGSRRFLYKVTRNLLGWIGDTGAYLRNTMEAMVLFGVPPEAYWDYDITNFDVEPPAFVYTLGQAYQAVRYLRLDSTGINREALIKRIKKFLIKGYPSMFGFSVYTSIAQARTNNGKIPYPCMSERRLGGHAVVAVGYNDNLEITNKNCGKTTKGAFIIRNSWGTGWGDKGYGYLPYDYVKNWLARDWWILTKAEWVDLDIFA